MKLLFIFLLSACLLKGFGQTPFEGKIVYNLHTPQEKEDAELTVFFGKKAVRLEFRTPHEMARQDLEYAVVLLDPGIILSVMPDSKTYKFSALKRKNAMPLPAPKEIAGFKASPVYTNINNVNSEFLYQLKNGILYTADELYFPLSEKYAGNPELMMIQNNRIVLGAEFDLSENYPANDTAETDSAVLLKNRLTATATSVMQQEQDTSLFAIPAGYSLYSYGTAADSTFTDSTIDVVDSSAAVPKKAIRKKQAKAPAKKKAMTKPPALHRKED